MLEAEKQCFQDEENNPSLPSIVIVSSMEMASLLDISINFSVVKNLETILFYDASVSQSHYRQIDVKYIFLTKCFTSLINN